MSVRWVNVLLQAINFLVLAWILKHVLYGRVREVLARRKAVVEEQLAAAAAEADRARAERSKAEALTRIATIEADKALEAVHAQAELEHERIREAARKEAEEIVASGRKRLAEEREEAGKQLEQAALRLSVTLAERILDELDPAAVTRLLLDRSLAHLDGLEPRRLADLAHQLGRDRVTIATATALDETTRTAAATRLGGRLGISPERVAFSVDAALRGGAEIRFPASAISLTWQGALEQLSLEVGNHEHAR
jgi:F-type H+-transporting ATPase subunit b